MAATARPRQRRYGSTTEKLGGSSEVYGRHQFRIQNPICPKVVLVRRRREGKIVTGGKEEKWTRCV
jgi:hypothetical protein